MRVAVFREAHFNAAHRLYVSTWTDAKNKEIFGVCNNPYFHGHNYQLIVKVAGETDPESGMLIDLNKLALIIDDHVINYLDHKNLNIEIVEFKTLNPTVENICYVIYEKLRKILDPVLDLQVRLYETSRNFAEYPV